MSATPTASARARLPAVFLSHATPMLGLQGVEDDEYVRALREFAGRLPARPEAVVVVSSYSLTAERSVEVNAAARPRIHYDFRGFPSALYQIEYPCPGSPPLAARIAALLADARFDASLRTDRGLDHGVWIPLRSAFPNADIPIVQLSLPHPARPEETLKLGRALAPLRDEGVLLVGSGSLVHNFDALVWHGKHGPAAAWAQEFEAWAQGRLRAKDVGSLCAFEQDAPSVKLAQPSPEHFHPLFFMLGASARGDELHAIFEGIQYSSLSMGSFALVAPDAPLRPAPTLM